MQDVNRMFITPFGISHILRDCKTQQEVSDLKCTNHTLIESYQWLKDEFIEAEVRVSKRVDLGPDGEGGEVYSMGHAI